jgi:Na+/melibiose symporter-like transporter
MGFVPGLPRTATQPESALLAITLSMAVIPAITNTLKVLLALQFRLPEAVPDDVQTPEKNS